MGDGNGCNAGEPARFAFLVHPLDMRDVIRYEPRAANKREPLVRKVLEWMPANIVSHVKGILSPTGTRAEGWFCLVPFLPAQFVGMTRETIYDKIVEAARLGLGRGARIVGLGGYTSVVGDAGETIAARLASEMAVTSGNSYTIATALQGAVEAARRLGIDIEAARVAVVGATGSIGSVCARYMAPRARQLVLAARNLGRLEKLTESIRREGHHEPEVRTSVEEAVRGADVVISATSSTGNIIQAEDIKSGALICDVSLPHDVCREVATARPDVLVIEGGLVDLPGAPDFGFDFGYPPGVSLACMAETILLALEGRYENFSIGRDLTIDHVNEVSRLAEKHGFKLAGFRSFDRFVTEDEISAVREAARRTRVGTRVFAVEPVREGAV